MAAILNPVNGRHQEMSGDIDSIIYKLGFVENLGVEVEIAPPSITIEKLFPLPV